MLSCPISQVWKGISVFCAYVDLSEDNGTCRQISRSSQNIKQHYFPFVCSSICVIVRPYQIGCGHTHICTVSSICMSQSMMIVLLLSARWLHCISSGFGSRVTSRCLAEAAYWYWPWLVIQSCLISYCGGLSAMGCDVGICECDNILCIQKKREDQ